jgi:hypothetical protein
MGREKKGEQNLYEEGTSYPAVSVTVLVSLKEF